MKKEIKIQVITKIPDVDKHDGNLCSEILVADIINDRPIFRPFRNLENVKNKINNKIQVKLEVFSLGEIIIINSGGREIGGIERNADKWFVSYKEFELSDIDKAVKLSRKLVK